MEKNLTSTEELYEALIDLESERLISSKINQESEHLLKGLNILVDGINETHILKNVITLLKEIVGCEDIIVMSLEHHILTTQAATSTEYYNIQLEPADFLNRILNNNLSISFDLQSIPEWQPLIPGLKNKIKSAIHIGLKVKKQDSVLICVDSKPQFFNRVHADLVKRYATLVTQALININSQEQIKSLNDNLLTVAHQAGMAEVAVSVIHNIGNVLNSVGVSVALMKEKMSHTLYDKISLLSEMLQRHNSDLIIYFKDDKQGRLIPGYLPVLFDEMKEHKESLDKEVTYLQQQYHIIKDILSAEQVVSDKHDFSEKVVVSHLMDLSIQTVITEDSLLLKNIKLNKYYHYKSFIYTYKTHLMQILVNLLKNAVESVMELDKKQKRCIDIVIESKEESENIEIRVKDNGMGILEENFPKIFTFGFTTKQKGHGFGLHNAALTAKQLGGSLTVESDGFLTGAQFILTLPMIKKYNSRNSEGKL